jgi:hypothetical protein
MPRIVDFKQAANARDSAPEVIKIRLLLQHSAMHHRRAATQRAVKRQTVIRNVAEHQRIIVLRQPIGILARR